MRMDHELEKVNPFHCVLNCIGGKWKMTILLEIHIHGKIRFNRTLKLLPVSEKVLSQQLKELIADGLVERVVRSNTQPPAVEYVLTKEGKQIIPALEILYIWGVRHLDALNVPADVDAFARQVAEQHMAALDNVTIYLRKESEDGVKTMVSSLSDAANPGEDGEDPAQEPQAQ